MPERVDKRWNERGIDCYPVEAIVGTLAHYGVTTDEQAFKQLAGEHFPLAIAARWHEGWKGTGQFSRFPAAAAEELWRRWLPDVLAPTDVALALINLLTALDEVLQGKPDDGTRETRFKVVEAYAPRLPTDLSQRERFLGEMTEALGEWIEAFDAIAEALAKKGEQALADRVAALDVALYPEQAGVPQALLQAVRGDVAGANQALTAIAEDPKRQFYGRLAAVDALLVHGAFDEAARLLRALIDVAAETKEGRWAVELMHRVQDLVRADRSLEAKHGLVARFEEVLGAFS